jgi:hypothetical protein
VRVTARLTAMALVVVGVLGAVAAASADAVRVAATASKSEVTVAEAFAVDVQANGPPGTVFTFPPEVVSESAELRPFPAPSPAADKAAGPAPDATPLPEGHHRYEARVFGLGEVKLPVLAVRYRLPDGTEGTAETEALTIRVGSLLPKDAQEQQLADIRGPVGVGVAPVFWLALGIALLVLGAVAYLIWRRLRRPKATVAALPVPELPPAAEAQAALEKLARAGHFARGDGRGYYIALTGIAKRYLERRLGAPIVEMTSAEMLGCLRDSPHGGELLGPMRDLATAADQVKFAKGEALRDEGERHLEATRRLVEKLEQRLAPAPLTETGGETGKAA